MKVDIGPYAYEGDDQKIEVRIDPWDTWSMDHTLAYIILPMLKQLKETTHGAPEVDDLDVPRYLRRSAEEKRDYNYKGITDDLWHDRWDWVLDEMIYAFESRVNDLDDIGEYDIGEYPEDENLREEYHQTLDRIQKGFMLFGKYYQDLWD